VNTNLGGKIALITGGASGIGLAAAKLLAAEGVKLALVDINAAGVAEAARTLSGITQAVGLPCDISNAGQVQAVVADATRRVGPVDIFINSAAVLDDKLFLESSLADWDRMLKICLYGPMLCLGALLPGMVERRYGRVICLASDAARIGQSRLSYYAAAKAGMIALIKSVAQEVGTRGVTLNVVSPGATNTPLRVEREKRLQEQMGDDKYQRRVNSVLRMYPLGRLGEPDDIAAAIVFLASDRAAWITGQVLSVNGGFTMP
jgi:NAD(P)-dependent dehydrogenase (short-subunit alcohol dehydrogenase family)